MTKTSKKKKKSNSKRHAYPIHVGITGSLASGKSTTLKVFSKHGYRILSADEIVHQIYAGENYDLLKLRKEAANSPRALKKLENFVHPIFRRILNKFLKEAKGPVAVEIPLLFEGGLNKCFDLNIFVFAPLVDRRKRAMNRGMSRRLFEFLESKQLPPAKKSEMADFVLLNLEKPTLKKQAKLLAKLLKTEK